jgi:hypothetical protein
MVRSIHIVVVASRGYGAVGVRGNAREDARLRGTPPTVLSHGFAEL